jgi:hypothetical protein
MEREPPSGPDSGEAFPTFDPDATAAPAPRPKPRRPQSRQQIQASPWLVGLAVAAVSVTLSIIAFGLFASGNGTAAPPPETTTTVPDDGTDPGNGDPGNGDPGTDPGNGTQVTVPGGGVTRPPIPSVGSAVPIAELTMTADAIGPFSFGTSGDEVLGRFVATFGQPTDDTGFIVGSGAWGECAGDSIRVVRWGPLNLVVRGEAGDSQFVSYRIDLRHGGVTSEVTDIATLSGLRVGDTVGELLNIYRDFDIVFIVDERVGPTFELRTSSVGDILLWGPVESQAENSLVTGIYSRDSCRAGSAD